MAEAILVIMGIVFLMMLGNSTAPPGVWSPVAQGGEVRFFISHISSNIRIE